MAGQGGFRHVGIGTAGGGDQKSGHLARLGGGFILQNLAAEAAESAATGDQ